MLEYYNLNDCFLILTYCTYLILSFVPINRNYEYECVIKSLQCLNVVFLFLKVYQLLRLFSNISFLVQMLISVFGDLLYFIMIFAVIIGGFTVLLEVILQSKANADEALVSKNTLLKKGFHEEEEAYSSYNGIQTIAFYVLAMRQSIGD